MMTKKEEYKRLIRLYYTQHVSQEEIDKIYTLKDDPIFQSVWEEVWEEGIPNELSDKPYDSSPLFARILADERIQSDLLPVIYHKKIKQWIVVKRIAAAAMLFFAISALYYWQFGFKNKGTSTANTANSFATAVVPGTSRAKILLEDGSAIDLEKIKGDTIIDRTEFSITKSAKGVISYQLKPSLHRFSNLLYHTIIVPQGGEYQLQLPDGTRVWLNASTTLNYPIVFKGQQREVVLNGEAYFEVAKLEFNNKRVPFIVKTGNQRLEVLGTKFNVNNYNQAVVTTLVEGKVKLNFPNTTIGSKILAPNGQSVYNAKAKQVDLIEVDPYYTIAWKEGNFAFEHASIYQVMADIGRWYNIDIHYNGDFKEVYFSGSISRYSSIDKLLNTISLAGGFKYELKERGIYIKR